MKEYPNLYEKAVEKYGEETRVDLLIEEMAELTQALCKYKRGLKHNIEEEIADVEIMINQVKTMINVIDPCKMKDWIEHKHIKLYKMITVGESND